MTKIAIVEDDPMIAEIYEKKFSDSGYEVSLASSGDQLLNLAKKINFDLVLLDLIMPKMDGFEVIKNLRSGSYSPETKIIIFSNLSQKEDRDKAYDLGANGFLNKSQYTPTNLVKEVERLIRQFKEEEKNAMRIANGGNVVNGKVGNSNEKKKRILMVEDEDVFVEMFGEKLRQDGFEFDFAKDGKEGLEKAAKNEYDIFIIDIILPGMGGEEVVLKLRQEAISRDVPIITMSAVGESEIARKVKEAGADCFFVKTHLIPSILSNEVFRLLGLE